MNTNLVTPKLAGTHWIAYVAQIQEADLDYLSKWRSYSPAFCQALQNEKLIGKKGGHLALPIADETGVVHGCHCRTFGDATIAKWHVNWFPNGQRQHCPFVIASESNPSVVFAFESQWDMFAFMDICGWHEGALGNSTTAFMATRGTANWKWVATLNADVVRIVIFPQNDLPGQKWGDKIVVAANRPVLRVATPHPHKDLNDWIRAGATDMDIEEAIKSAVESRKPITKADIRDDETPIFIGYEPALPSRQLADGRSVIISPGDDHLLSAFADELGNALSHTNLFRRNGRVFTVNCERGTLELMQADLFRTWHEEYVVCSRIKQGERGQQKMVTHTINRWDAQDVLVAHSFIKHLRQIEMVNPVPLPVIRNSGALELLGTGYDSETKSFTVQPDRVHVAGTMSLTEAKAILDEILSEFCFAPDNGLSHAVAVAAMLTPFGRWLVSPQAIIPAFLMAANAEGAGKSLLAQLATVPLMGACAMSPKPEGEDEIRKRLLCAVMNGELTFVLDNVKDHLSSQSLEAFLTSHVWSDRILGASKTFHGEKRTVVFITGNSCTLSGDMRRRCLVCELFIQEGHAENRVFKRNLDSAYMMKHRNEILNALMGLIGAWNLAGRPKPTKSNASFPEWADVIGGIVENAGYSCPVQSSGHYQIVDHELADIQSILRALASEDGKRECTFREIAQHAHLVGAFENLFDDDGILDRKGKSIFSKLLRRYNRRTIGGLSLIIRDGVRDLRYVVTGYPPRPTEGDLA
jgi:hypothetical protein